MGRNCSKLSAESLVRQSSATCADTDIRNIRVSMSSLSEKNSRDCCGGSNKHNIEAHLSLIMDDQQLFLPFLTQVFYQEVELSDCMQTLFRGNCLASRIMSHCFRTFGSDYLKRLLEPHIKPLTIYKTNANYRSSTQTDSIRSSSSMLIDQQVPTNTRTSRSNSDSSTAKLDGPHSRSESNENQQLQLQDHRHKPDDTEIDLDPNVLPSYEIDPSRVEVDDNIDRNRDNLLKLTRKILNSILVSAQDFPPQLNSMCICLSQVLHKKFPDSDTNTRAVGTVIFLRFINPAIVSPYESGIVHTQPHPRVMRGLMLVSKILQNIANNVEFSKEQHMLPFNTFVRQQFEPMRKWIAEITDERNRYHETKPNEDINGT